jgi:outer membrane protein OmpA-like peptidoglycan-associated protein
VITIAIILLAALTAYSQQSQRAIILINGIAHIADLSPNGSVIAFYQSLPDYFKSNDSDQSFIARLEQQGLTEGGSLDLYADQDDPLQTDFARIKEYSGDERQYIAFTRGRAILSRDAVSQIKSLADAYRSNEIKEVIINAYHDNSQRQKRLALNRSKAIKDLLETFGIPYKQIQRNAPYGDEGDQLYFVYLRTVQ